jgi:hypothetical protein
MLLGSPVAASEGVVDVVTRTNTRKLQSKQKSGKTGGIDVGDGHFKFEGFWEVFGISKLGREL